MKRKVASRIINSRKKMRGERSRREWMLLVKAARDYSVIGARKKVASRIRVLFAEVWCVEDRGVIRRGVVRRGR